MSNYITKKNILNLLTFISFLLGVALTTFELSSETVQYITFIVAAIGFWINTDKKETEEQVTT